MKITLINIIPITFILFQNVSAEINDTLFISSDKLMEGNFYLAASNSELPDEILWHFSPGDDPRWADPLYDDSNWELVNPWLNVLKPEAKKWGGIGWFRKVIKIDSSLTSKTIGVHLHQDGASEVFLNGKKIFTFGKVSEDKIEEKFYDPFYSPYVFSFDSNTVYTIAIRYSNHSDVGWEYFYNKFFGHLGFSISLFDFDRNIDSDLLLIHKRTSFDWVINGFAIAFSLIFFLLYFFYSKRKQNLYFASFVFGIALMSTSSDLQLIGNTSLELIAVYRIVQFIAFSFIFTFFLLFIYETVYHRIIKLFWAFFAAFIAINGFAFFGSSAIFDNMMPLAIVLSILTIESFRVFIIGIVRKVENIRILAIGSIIFLILFLSSFFISPLIPKSILTVLVMPLMFLNITVLPVFMAIYLAKSYGKTQTDLEDKIISVQELSAKQIEQERKNAELQLQAELERAENKRKTEELEQARKLQLSMLPEVVPLLPDTDITAYMKTATEVGGDYYDFHVSESSVLTNVIGDATGHGLDAGMLVSITKGLFHNLAPQPELEQVIAQLNSAFISMKLAPRYMSLALLRISGNHLKVIGAGMPPFLFYQKSSGTINEIEPSGPLLGAFPEYKYPVRNYDLSTGDIILLMSDGFIERRNAAGEMYGWEQGKHLFSTVTHLNSQQIIEEFVKAGDAWAEGSVQDDDITFVVFKIQ